MFRNPNLEFLCEWLGRGLDLKSLYGGFRYLFNSQ